jgi:multicomponent K+:H+ antiporter subunit D
MVWAWTAILAGSLLTIVGFARAGSALFWKSTAVEVPAAPAPEAPPPAARALEVAPAMATIAILAALAVFAGPVAGYLEGTSAQLFDRAGYIAAVMPDGEGP